MTLLYGEEKPPLEHYGVKGMKWGVRKERPSGDEIQDARVRVYNQQRDIRRARKANRKSTKRGSVERAKGEKKVGQMELKLLKDPDRITASRITNGEAFVSLVLLTPGGAAGYLGGRALATKLVETEVKRARRGDYDDDYK
jgi:hypothetical protein